MTLSAAQALFYNQSALILSGLPNTTQYVTYPPMPKAGEVSQVNLRTLAPTLSILHLLCFVLEIFHGVSIAPSMPCLLIRRDKTDLPSTSQTGSKCVAPSATCTCCCFGALRDVAVR